MSQTVRTNLASSKASAKWGTVAGTGGTVSGAWNTGAGYQRAGFFRATWSAPTTVPSGGVTFTETGLAASTQYTHQILLRSSKAQTVQVFAQYQTSGSVNDGSSVTGPSVTLAANTWTVAYVTATSGASTAKVVLTAAATGVGSNWASGDTLDGDLVTLVAEPIPGPVFDGAYTSAGAVMYAWTAAVDASPSTATTYVPAIALSPVADAHPCPRVVVTLTDLTPTDNTVNLWRTADGTRTAVRGAKGFTVNGCTAITDYEVPLGRTVSYDLEIVSGVTKGALTPTATTTVNSPADAAGKPTWWIQDPLVPGSAIALAVARGDKSRPSLTAAAVKNLEYASDITIIPVAGSNQPIAIGGQRMVASNVPFDMFTDTAQTTTSLRNLLQQTSILLIRPPGTGRESGIPGLFYTAVPKAVEQPVTVAYGGTLTKWSVTGTGVAAPSASILVPVWTYGSVQALWNTYQDAQTAYSSRGFTYLDVLKSPTG